MLLKMKPVYRKSPSPLSKVKLYVSLIILVMVWHLTSLVVMAAPGENLLTPVRPDRSHITGQAFTQRMEIEPAAWLTSTTLLTTSQAVALPADHSEPVCPALESPAVEDSTQQYLAKQFLSTAMQLVDTFQSEAALTERVTILLLGSDHRPDEKFGRADTMILVTIDPISKTAGMLSVPRDLWVTIPGYGENRLNMAYRLGELKQYPGGGPALAMETIEANLGVTIDHYVLVDFDGFKQIVDTLGGIDVCVPETIDAAAYYGYAAESINKEAYYSFVPAPPEGPVETVNASTGSQDTATGLLSDDQEQGYKFLYIEAGWHTLDGYTALRYARSRASVTADFARVMRQQAVLLAIREKALRLDIIPKTPELWQTMGHIIDTDLQLTDILQVAQLAYDIPRENIRTAAISHEQTQGYTTSKGASVLLPRRAEIKVLVEDMFGASHPTAPLTQAELAVAQVSSDAGETVAVDHLQGQAEAQQN